MKIPQFLKDRTGRAALTAVQAAVLAGAVGVVGVAAWQMFGPGAPKEEIAFGQNEQEEVVFVAGGPGAGAYSGVGYGEGGEVRSGISAKLSKDMELMQIDAQRAQIPQEPQVIEQERQVSAYQMDGATDGLGMGQNAAKEMGVAGGSDMSAVQQQIAALQAQALSKQQEAQAAAGDASAMAALLKGQGGGPGKWGMAQGMARAGGSNLNSMPLQAGAYGAEGESLRAAQERVRQMPDMLAKSAREVKFAGGRDGAVGPGRNLGRGDALEQMQKQSSDIAGNNNRSANESTRVFMAGRKMSGGINIVGETANTGASASSEDFNNSNTQIGALDSALGEIQEEGNEYEQDRVKLRNQLWGFTAAAAVVQALAVTGGYLKWLPKLLFMIGVGIAAAGLLTWYGFMQRSITAFRHKWYSGGRRAKYEHNHFDAKARSLSTTILGTTGTVVGLAWVSGFAAAMAMAASTAVIGTLWAINFNSSSDEDDQAAIEEASGGMVPTSPYGPNVADDVLYLHEDKLTDTPRGK